MPVAFDVDALRALVRSAETDDRTPAARRDEVCARIDDWARADPGPPEAVLAIRTELGRTSPDDVEELRAQLGLLERTLADAAG
jgi:hypothetical protein